MNDRRTFLGLLASLFMLGDKKSPVPINSTETIRKIVIPPNLKPGEIQIATVRFQLDGTSFTDLGPVLKLNKLPPAEINRESAFEYTPCPPSPSSGKPKTDGSFGRKTGVSESEFS